MSTESGSRGPVIADLVQRFEGHLADHRECVGLAGSILEVTSDAAVWGIAWMRCPECRVWWERHLALNGAA